MRDRDTLGRGNNRTLVKKGCTYMYLEVGIDVLNTIKYLQNPQYKSSLSALTPKNSRLENGKRIAISNRYETSLKR